MLPQDWKTNTVAQQLINLTNGYYTIKRTENPNAIILEDLRFGTFKTTKEASSIFSYTLEKTREGGTMFAMNRTRVNNPWPTLKKIYKWGISGDDNENI